MTLQALADFLTPFFTSLPLKTRSKYVKNYIYLSKHMVHKLPIISEVLAAMVARYQSLARVTAAMHR